MRTSCEVYVIRVHRSLMLYGLTSDQAKAKICANQARVEEAYRKRIAAVAIARHLHREPNPITGNEALAIGGGVAALALLVYALWPKKDAAPATPAPPANNGGAGGTNPGTPGPTPRGGRPGGNPVTGGGGSISPNPTTTPPAPQGGGSQFVPGPGGGTLHP